MKDDTNLQIYRMSQEEMTVFWEVIISAILPRQSTTRASLELGISQSTVWRIIRKRLKCKPYRLQLHQHPSDNDRVVRLNFCIEMQERFEVEGFADTLIFSDGATFHLCGKLNRHSVRIWGTRQHVRDSPEANVFCAISKKNVYGPIFFAEPTVTVMIYLDMLEDWLMPQLNEDTNDYLFQQDPTVSLITAKTCEGISMKCCHKDG
ncbi:hypothetical protein B7P43_G06350 [Cryptotermes secundus]|uniref:Transposase Tc1-like domain-containing protein n=1 Tax=Cryptotermes secundus TaxID=105785 RepID=A0A2J7QBT2_9NEOP|nr:hypothetical protein B7P43_G06350 [Cryptotermes secundus]